MALPTGGEARMLVAASLVWSGALLGRHPFGLWAALAGGGAILLVKRSARVAVLAVALAAGAWAGWGAFHREQDMLSAPVVEGRVTIRAVARTDPVGIPDQVWLLAKPLAYRVAEEDGWKEWSGPVVLVEPSDAGQVAAGEVFETSGLISKRPGRRGTAAYAARMRSGGLARLSPAQGWLVAAGNQMRRRVIGNLLTGPPDGLALVAGFLVGDTSGLSAIDLANLRRSGLSHYVAVSGGNVALFLGALWMLMWPLARRPGLRAGVGLIGLGMFVVATRWEPSVLRAGVLASLVMGARAVGYPLGAWTAIGATVVLALLVSAELAVSLGFALSVAATLGVMVGMRLAADRRPRWVWQTLGATVAAQAAVAPLVLSFFGTLPLLSPLANLAAGPLVAVSTGLGGVGALAGWRPLVWLSAWAAEGVLAVARFASLFPQLNWMGVVVVSCVGAAAWRWPVIRGPVLATGVALLVAVPMLPVFPSLAGYGGADPPAVVFLDVGQGDSILVMGTGFTMLIDGGPDPLVLADKLRAYGVRELDLLVITHPHADHVRGLEAVVGEIPVGAVWDASHPHRTPAHRVLRERITAQEIAIHRPLPGQRFSAGDLQVEVLGPLRRYEHMNDQSIVLAVDLAGTSFLMAADIEEVAQAEQGPIRPDVLKVPHQGAATSDRGWLKENAGRLAVISVGPNDYGHPARWVEEVLAEGGARVLRTDRHGDVVVRPSGAEQLSGPSAMAKLG